MSSKSLVLFFISLLTSGLLSTSFSQQVAARLQQLTKEADVILTGKVTEQQSSWNQNKTRIITHTTIQVEDYIKGDNTGNIVVVNHLGGEVGDVGELYSHMPEFKNDEEVLLFLKKDKSNTGYQVYSGEDGKISIMNNPKTGEKVTALNIPVGVIKKQIRAIETRSNN
jgi:hypothetical protein